jgi:chaperonin GroES
MAKLNIKPLGSNVVIKPIEKEAKTAGGILIPETAKEKPQEGEVVAVGSGKTLDNGTKVAPEVKVGDKVLYKNQYGNETIKIEGVEYLILPESNILGIVS